MLVYCAMDSAAVNCGTFKWIQIVKMDVSTGENVLLDGTKVHTTVKIFADHQLTLVDAIL